MEHRRRPHRNGKCTGRIARYRAWKSTSSHECEKERERKREREGPCAGRCITDDGDTWQPVIAHVKVHDLQRDGRRTARVSASTLLCVPLAAAASRSCCRDWAQTGSRRSIVSGIHCCRINYTCVTSRRDLATWTSQERKRLGSPKRTHPSLFSHSPLAP